MTTPRRRITFPPGLPKAEQIARAMSFVDEGWRDENRALASKAMDLTGEDFDPDIYDAVVDLRSLGRRSGAPRFSRNSASYLA